MIILMYYSSLGYDVSIQPTSSYSEWIKIWPKETRLTLFAKTIFFVKVEGVLNTLHVSVQMIIGRETLYYL